ncbi:MAG: ABC transporter ATP-binding protein, partial [Chloroflexota bacterium]
MLKNKVKKNIKSSRNRTANDILSDSLRQRIRAISGGDRWVWRFVRGLLWKNRIFLALAILLNLITALLEISTLAIFYLAIDMLTGSFTNTQTTGSLGFLSDFQTVVVNRFGIEGGFLFFIFSAGAFQVLRSGSQLSGRVLFAYVRGWIEGDLRHRLLFQITNIHYADISKKKVGELSIYAEHINHVGLLVSHLSGLLTQGLILVSYAGFLIWLSWQLSLLALLMLGLISIGLRIVRRRVRTASDQYMTASVDFSGKIVEFIRGLRIVHLFNRKEYAVNMMKPVIDQTIQKKRSEMIWSGSTTPIVEACAAVGVAGFLLVGYRLYTAQGAAVLASLTTFVLVLYRLLPRASAVNNLLNNIGREWPFVTRLANFLSKENKTFVQGGTSKIGKFSKEIILQNVSLTYDGAQADSLSNLNLKLNKGQTIAFVGPSGAGKSSMINLIMRLYDPSQGQILVDGTPLKELSLSSWRSKIGVVDQDTFIFNNSIIENIRFG